LGTYAEVTGKSQMDMVPEGIQPHCSLIYSFRLFIWPFCLHESW